MVARSFEDLQVWQKAHQLVLKTYRLSALFPNDERFGLTSQLRRAMVSVPANIAEGFIKRGKSDKARFYNMAEGSLEECRYYFILTRDLGFANTQEMLEHLEEVSRMLRSYTAAVMASKFNMRGTSLLAILSGGIFFLLLASCFLLLKGLSHG